MFFGPQTVPGTDSGNGQNSVNSSRIDIIQKTSFAEGGPGFFSVEKKVRKNDVKTDFLLAGGGPLPEKTVDSIFFDSYIFA